MRVLMLSWEYPPLIVGGLGRHVGALAVELARTGHDVVVVTRGGPSDERRHGVRVLRCALDPIELDFTTETLLSWAQAGEHSLLRAALPLLGDWRPDVVHAHDWLVAQSAITVSGLVGCPLVATIHATESGRNQGWLPAPLNRAIHSIERWLATTADAVITCSGAMRDEVERRFEVQARVVPNGIHVPAWQPRPAARAEARARYAGDGPLLVYAGRLVHEKGPQVLIAALPRLRRRFPGLHVVVAGTGPMAEQLRASAGRRVQWAGFLAERPLAALFGAADAVVVPSIYEPFGLVALEAAAAGAPLAVADTGGLRDLVHDGVSGVRFEPDSPPALARAAGGLLADPARGRRLARAARRAVRTDFSWRAVAVRTAAIYAGSEPGDAGG